MTRLICWTQEKSQIEIRIKEIKILKVGQLSSIYEES